MEFCGREPMDVLGIGDCSNNYGKFPWKQVARGGSGWAFWGVC